MLIDNIKPKLPFEFENQISKLLLGFDLWCKGSKMETRFRDLKSEFEVRNLVLRFETDRDIFSHSLKGTVVAE